MTMSGAAALGRMLLARRRFEAERRGEVIPLWRTNGDTPYEDEYYCGACGATTGSSAECLACGAQRP